MTSQRFTQSWINRDIRRLTRLKRRWLRRARSNEQKDCEKYKALKKKTQKACRDGHDNYVNDILTNDSKNPKKYWYFIKSKKKDNTGMAPLKKDGLTFCDRQNQANIMGNQFSSVYTADDSLLYRKIGSKQDCVELQQDLDRLQEWEKKWKMAFNAEKCEVLCISNKKHPLQHSYFIHGQKLATKTDSKYLGVTISSNLSWSKHVNNISKKANSTMAFLRRNIRSASQQAIGEYCLQDVCETNSQICLNSLDSTRH